MSRRVGLLLRRSKPEALEIAADLVALLGELGHVPSLVVGNDGSDDPEATEQERVSLRAVSTVPILEASQAGTQLDLLVVLGGDGTILRGAALVADHGVPILGLNLGTLGFLSSAPPSDARAVLGRALDGTLPLEERLRLRCELQLRNGERIVRHAANDAVVSQGALARLIELDVTVDDKALTRYRADGLIIATPTGSTGYNLSAGGPIIAPDVRAVVIAPICPHTLTNRPIVLPAAGRIAVTLASQADHVLLTIDGQWGHRIGTGDRVVLSEAAQPLYLFRAAQGHFGVLREKLRWGE